jgi:hypothetical protein
VKSAQFADRPDAEGGQPVDEEAAVASYGHGVTVISPESPAATSSPEPFPRHTGVEGVLCTLNPQLQTPHSSQGVLSASVHPPLSKTPMGCYATAQGATTCDP